MDVEDAVSISMVDLFEYWVGLPSSIDLSDTGKTFAFATRRGVWTATNYLIKLHHEYGNRVRLEEYGDGHMTTTPLKEGGVQLVPLGRAKEAFTDNETPEDILIAAADRDAVRFVVSNLTEEEREQWFDAFASGLTTREAAEIAEVNQSTVARRRKVGMRRFASEVAA